MILEIATGSTIRSTVHGHALNKAVNGHSTLQIVHGIVSKSSYQVKAEKNATTLVKISRPLTTES